MRPELWSLCHFCYGIHPQTWRVKDGKHQGATETRVGKALSGNACAVCLGPSRN